MTITKKWNRAQLLAQAAYWRDEFHKLSRKHSGMLLTGNEEDAAFCYSKLIYAAEQCRQYHKQAAMTK